jgi:hypothetical protein
MPADRDVLDLLRRHDPAEGTAPPSPEVLEEARRRAAAGGGVGGAARRRAAAGGGVGGPARRRAAAGGGAGGPARRPLRRGALALTGAAAVTLALLAGLPSGGGAPRDAAAALRAAVDRTAGAAHSGRMTWEVDERGPGIEHHVRSTIRWDGDDFASTASYDGKADEHVFADGRHYERRAGERWRAPGLRHVGRVREHIVSRLTDAGLLDALRAASSVTREERDGGGERFTGTLTSEQLAKAGRQNAIAYLLASRPGFDPPEPAKVEVETDGEGRIAEVVLEQRRGELTTRVRSAFDDLGEPQGIEAPTAAAATP